MSLWRCSEARGHVWSWSASTTTQEAIVPDGIQCACGAYLWRDGKAMLMVEALIA